MNDNVKGDKADARCPSSHTPVWWTDSIEISWSKVKAKMIQDWHIVARCQSNLEHRINGEALALGHGAHEQYHRVQAWSRELEDLLKADWEQTGHRAECTWEKVHAAVRQGFEQACGAAKAAAERPAARGAESPFLGGY